jgi:glutamine synthetase type III
MTSLHAELVKRLRVLTLNLLPVEVEADSLTDVTSRVITPAVITAYTAAAGDFVEAVRVGDAS